VCAAAGAGGEDALGGEVRCVVDGVWGVVVALVAGAGGVAWTVARWAWRRRVVLGEAVGEGMVFAEKFKHGAPNAELEAAAVAYIGAHWPEFPSWLVREAVRALCARRKERAAYVLGEVEYGAI